jgi:D-Tyr-tRNAtyr deacylase
MSENWKSINGYENYEISDHGNIKNITTHKMLSPSIRSSGYYFIEVYDNKIRRTKAIHRLVAEAFLDNHDNKRCVDHIDRNKLNNHISNLRYASDSENQMNKSIQSNNTSGVIGVRFNKTKNKWIADIKKDGKSKHLGSFKTKEEAILARQKAEETYFKEFRAQNIYNISNSSNITINNS